MWGSVGGLPPLLRRASDRLPDFLLQVELIEEKKQRSTEIGKLSSSLQVSCA